MKTAIKTAKLGRRILSGICAAAVSLPAAAEPVLPPPALFRRIRRKFHNLGGIRQIRRRGGGFAAAGEWNRIRAGQSVY